MMTAPAPAPTVNRLVSGVLLVLALPVVAAATLMGLVWFGPLGLFLMPVLIVSAVALYRATVRSMGSSQTRAVAREVGAAVLAVGSGFGAWVACMILGVLTGVLPFMTGPEDHPFVSEWEAASVLVGIVVVPLTWWLLRRWVDARRAA